MKSDFKKLKVASEIDMESLFLAMKDRKLSRVIKKYGEASEKSKKAFLREAKAIVG